MEQGRKLPRSLKEELAKFFQDPSRERLREVLRLHVGEENGLDFKADWPAYPKLAKHILAIANYASSAAVDGGFIVVGVREDERGRLHSDGLSAFTDSADITRGVGRYLPHQLAFDVMDFSYEESEYAKIQGKNFQVVRIGADVREVPFLATKDGDGITAGDIYVRRGTQSVRATHDEVKDLLAANIRSYSSAEEFDLEQRIEMLRTLYRQLAKDPLPMQLSAVEQLASQLQRSWMMSGLEYSDVARPDESLREFLVRMIHQLKENIEDSLSF